MESFFQFLMVSLIPFQNLASAQSSANNSNEDSPPCFPALCSKTPQQERCSCRPDCYLYNECCSDMSNNTTSEHKQPYPSTYYSCRNANSSYYYQFDRCPPNHDITEFVSNCENPNSEDQLQNIPAFGKTSKKLYRNLYCALCHGEEFILWNLRFDCPESGNVNLEKLSDFVEDHNCRKQLEIPSKDLDQYLFSCNPYISSCPEHNNYTKLEVACEYEPMALVKSDSKLFRNSHCAVCHGLKEIYDWCKENRGTNEMKQMPSLSILFDYRTNVFVIYDKKSSNRNVGKLPSCLKNSVFDINTRQCRQVVYNSPLNCTATRLSKSEYYITSDGLLYLNNTQRFLNQSEFIQDADGIISICIKNGGNGVSKYSIAEGYITLVGLVISIPALAVTIIVYLCIPDLHTLPGKLLISLLSALFVAELLFLISSQVTKSTVLCKSLAIMMHYLFLATFFWMNVMSFDAWYTFSGFKQLRSSGKNTKRLVLYSLYGWICPLVIVTISLVFEYTPGNHISPEYGNGICWITNGNGLLWLFATPVLLLLCLNILAFILTSRGLYMARKLSSKYLRKRNKLEFLIYIKLCFVMGLTWIFAFFYAFTRIDEFSLLFCILNSFTGLFICLSFLFTKIVCRRLLKKVHKFQKRSPTKSMALSSTSSKTLMTDTFSQIP
ncbi:uncharacterized protein LOC118764985 [Octopus sinensis]|uniref:Uncharacterized protein LOC118764985 n=1 Tax=Octopus sinensis TaxID=2607531 RepID=A0A7E6F4A5_9MOLL|nr:uncharacterized protein LOC118764985 [Octopus sinensis]